MDSKAYVMILGQIELVEVVNLYYLILTSGSFRWFVSRIFSLIFSLIFSIEKIGLNQWFNQVDLITGLNQANPGNSWHHTFTYGIIVSGPPRVFKFITNKT